MVRFARLIHTAGAAFLAEPVPHLPGERERYERIAATAVELARVVIDLAEGGFDPLELAEGDSDPLDTVVESITALIDDTVALSASTPPSRGHSPAPRSTKRGATAFPSSRLSTTIRQIAAINDQMVITVVAADEPAGLAGLTGRFDAVVEATNDPAGAATALALLRRGAPRSCSASPVYGERRSTRTW